MSCKNKSNLGFNKTLKCSIFLRQDISFFCCIELLGPEHSLLGGLQQLAGPKDKMGPTFDSPKFLDGRKEGSAWIYHPGRFPSGVVGKVSFLWKPASDKSQPRTVWIWSHPSFYDEFLLVLKSVFGLGEKPAKETVEVSCRRLFLAEKNWLLTIVLILASCFCVFSTVFESNLLTN